MSHAQKSPLPTEQQQTAVRDASCMAGVSSKNFLLIMANADNWQSFVPHPSLPSPVLFQPTWKQRIGTLAPNAQMPPNSQMNEAQLAFQANSNEKSLVTMAPSSPVECCHFWKSQKGMWWQNMCTRDLDSFNRTSICVANNRVPMHGSTVS